MMACSSGAVRSAEAARERLARIRHRPGACKVPEALRLDILPRCLTLSKGLEFGVVKEEAFSAEEHGVHQTT